MGLLDALRADFANFSCELALSNDLFSNLTRNLAFGFNQEAIERYRRNQQVLWCNKSPYDAPFIPGRCPIKYRVVVTRQITGHPNPIFNNIADTIYFVWGPIGRASFIVEEVDGPGGRQTVRQTLAHHGPENLERSVTWQTSIGPPGEFHELATYTILNVQATPLNSGESNSCPTFVDDTPYDPQVHTYPRPITYVTNNNVSVTVPLIFAVGLFKLNANLELIVPVNIKIAPEFNFKTQIPIDINAEFNWSTGDTNLDWGGGELTEPSPPALPPTSRPPITSPTSPAPPKPPSIPDAEPDPDDAKENRQLIGVVVTSAFTADKPSATTIFQGDNPDIQVPTLGYVSFAIRTASNVVGWTNDIPVKNLRAYIPVPPNTTAIRAAGTPRPDVNWTLTPVYERALVEVS